MIQIKISKRINVEKYKYGIKIFITLNHSENNRNNECIKLTERELRLLKYILDNKILV